MPGAMEPLANDIRRAALRIAQRQAVALAPYGVTPAEWAVLRVLYDLGATPPSKLADACGLTRGAVTKLVDRLRAKRLLVRAGAGGEDRRYQTIALTGDGAKLVPVLAQVTAAGEAAMFGSVAPRDRAMLSSLLATLARD